VRNLAHPGEFLLPHYAYNAAFSLILNLCFTTSQQLNHLNNLTTSTTTLAPSKVTLDGRSKTDWSLNCDAATVTTPQSPKE
jgi:hypothetical protein